MTGGSASPFPVAKVRDLRDWMDGVAISVGQRDHTGSFEAGIIGATKTLADNLDKLLAEVGGRVPREPRPLEPANPGSRLAEALERAQRLHDSIQGPTSIPKPMVGLGNFLHEFMDRAERLLRRPS